MKNFIVTSSHGELLVNSETGTIISLTSSKDEEDYLPTIIKFDVTEYKKYYGVTEIPEIIDILDIGYTTNDGKTETPEKEWRNEHRILEFNEVDAGWFMCEETETLAIASKEQPYLKMENIDHFEVYQFDENDQEVTNQRLIGIFDTMHQAIAYASHVFTNKINEPYFSIGHPETISLEIPVSIHALVQLNQLTETLPLEKWQIELLNSIEVGEEAFQDLNIETVKRVG